MGHSIATRGPFYLLFAVLVPRGCVHHAIQGAPIASQPRLGITWPIVLRRNAQTAGHTRSFRGMSGYGDNWRTGGQIYVRSTLPVPEDIYMLIAKTRDLSLFNPVRPKWGCFRCWFESRRTRRRI